MNSNQLSKSLDHLLHHNFNLVYFQSSLKLRMMRKCLSTLRTRELKLVMVDGTAFQLDLQTLQIQESFDSVVPQDTGIACGTNKLYVVW